MNDKYQTPLRILRTDLADDLAASANKESLCLLCNVSYRVVIMQLLEPFGRTIA